MEEKEEQTNTDEWLKDLPLQTENPAFNAEEMIACTKCARTNPPTRLKCFYCDAELDISEAQSGFLRPNLRKLEVWEKGFNLIFQNKNEDFDESKLPEIAKMLKLEKDFLQKMFNEQKTLPLARAEAEKEAEIVRKRLQEFGIETTILSDESLAVENPPKRLRGIEFWDDKIIFVLFNKDEIIEISNDDLILIVSGAIFERKVEAVEKHNKKGENKLLETDETTSDEFLIDIYSRQNKLGYRIFAKGFDFSSLETEKQLLAVENMRKLVKKLREVAPNAKFVDDYLQARESLGGIWEVELKTDSQGLKRKGFGNFNLSNITIADNKIQFTKYSRLQREII
ncbi:hypothetical protein BH20ACI1_BH20ACI1_08400 [soil metagenome]